MDTGRLEAFTDGVIAIVITIMVLEMKAPEGSGFAALTAGTPIFLAYVLSYVNVGIFWNNHHHMLHATERVDGNVLWANLFLLFWISLMPFSIRWMNEAHYTGLPTAAYGVALMMASLGYLLLEWTIVACNGASSTLARAVGRDTKGNCRCWCTRSRSRWPSSAHGSPSSYTLRSRSCGWCRTGALNRSLRNEPA